MRAEFSVRFISWCLIATFLGVAKTYASPVFINELHYDNAGGDVGEGVEIAGPAGVDITDWNLVFYNGSNGKPYLRHSLSGVIQDQSNGFGVRAFGISGVQNGAPDGVALVNALSEVLQFLSYEGEFVAIEGEAAGLTSSGIGSTETATTKSGFSLQLTGTGSDYADFSWQDPREDSFGVINQGQVFRATGAGELPLPNTLWLILPFMMAVLVGRYLNRYLGKAR